jgi:hypothetical protein
VAAMVSLGFTEKVGSFADDVSHWFVTDTWSSRMRNTRALSIDLDLLTT